MKPKTFDTKKSAVGTNIIKGQFIYYNSRRRGDVVNADAHNCRRGGKSDIICEQLQTRASKSLCASTSCSGAGAGVCNCFHQLATTQAIGLSEPLLCSFCRVAKTFRANITKHCSSVFLLCKSKETLLAKNNKHFCLLSSFK